MGDKVKFIEIGSKSINAYDIVAHYIVDQSYIIDLVSDRHIFNSPVDISDPEAAKQEVADVLTQIENDQ